MAAAHWHRLEADGNSHDPDSGPNNRYSFCWAKFSSPTTLKHQNESRTVAWGSGQLYAGKKFVTLWSFKPVQGDAPGRVLNFHNHPNFGGWEPDNSNGVSSFAIDWFGSRGLELVLEPNSPNGNYHYQILSDSEVKSARSKGEWIDLTIVGTIGANKDGSVKIYVNGSNTPKVNLSNVSNSWKSQTGWAVWEGLYNSSGLSGTHALEYVPARFGRTVEEALNDLAVKEDGLWGAQANNGGNAWRHTTLGTRDTDLFRLPSDLGGTPAPDPDPTPDPTPVPQYKLDLEAGWKNIKNASIHNKWATQNPGEADKLNTFWASGGTAPVLSTEYGKAWVNVAKAKWAK